MKVDALWMIGEHKVGVQPVEIGDPDYGQVQVEIKACGICAADIYFFKGGDGKREYPFQFGHEGVGIVRKVGRGVNGVKPGDKVFAAGGGQMMAQLVNLPLQYIARIPDDIIDYSLWVGEPVACVVNGIDQLDMRPADHVVVIGTGFMGLLNVQGLISTLAGRITAFDINQDRLKLAGEFGVDEVYVPNSKEANKAVDKIKAAGGADIVIECSGTQSGLDMAADLLKKGGTLSLFAWHKGMRSLDGTRWHMGGFRVLNTSPMIDLHYVGRIGQAAILMRKGVFSLDRLITHVDHYRNAQQIFETAAAGFNGYIKGVITF